MEPLLTIPEAIRLNPEDAAAYNNRGIIKKKRGDLSNGSIQISSFFLDNPAVVVGCRIFRIEANRFRYSQQWLHPDLLFFS